MSEKIVVRLEPSQRFPDRLTVEDAFHQVIDVFKLVAQSVPELADDVEWRLVSVSFNSPFTVVAESAAKRPGADAAKSAKVQVGAFSKNLRDLQRGVIPAPWSSVKSRDIAERFIERSSFRIGQTIIGSPDDKPEEVEYFTADVARVAFEAIQNASGIKFKPKSQIGSIEGRLSMVDRYYKQPAIKVIEGRSAREIWCVVPEHLRREIAQSASVDDFWEGRRVVVHGRLIYDQNGKVSRLEATSIKRLSELVVADEELVDPNFTGGLASEKYVSDLRGGDLG